MAQKLNPFSGRQFLDASGDPYSGAQLFVYTAGSSTKATVTKDSAGLSAHANPIILNSRGEPGDGAGASQAIWQTEGETVKLVLAPSTDTDPPVAAISTWDNISGINDTTVTIDQWIGGPAPTYVGATSFTLVGDQTTVFHVGRRLKTTNTAGTVYSTITASAYTSLTTITVVNDSGSLDAGLSAVSYGVLTHTNTSNPVDVATTAGDILYHTGTLYQRLAAGGSGQVPAINAAGTAPEYWAPKGHISGLILSNDTDTDHDINITAGEATDSTDGYVLKLTSEITKQIDATWAAGDDAGGLFSGSVAVDTWYHVFLIRKDSDGSIDAGFDTSVTAANIPAGYTSYRRLGSVLTDGSGNILGFQQFNKCFIFDSPVLDLNTATSGIVKINRTLSVPPGFSVLAKFNVMSEHSAAADRLYVSHPDSTDLAPSTSATPLASTGGYNAAADAEDMSQLECFTNTSSQIATRSSANNDLRIATLGWEELSL